MQQPSDPERIQSKNTLHLNPSQQYAVDTICTNWEKQAGRYLLFGVTGSGKTAVYMELIAHVRCRGESRRFC
ncbi:MAG: DEAD/DEAH box helicase family protein [Lachnospiraceae bacterium]